jgi:hemoglobin-like flavoprotein
MTPQQVALVQASFAKIAPIAEQAAALFYSRLFETAPETRSLFSADIDAQGRKLMAAITAVVSNLDQIEAIAPTIHELAKRHVAYAVRPDHYPIVGAALLWTLGKGLAGDFTPEVAAAWTSAYAALSEMMIAAAYPGEPS